MELEKLVRRVWLRYFALCHSGSCPKIFTDRVLFVEVNRLLAKEGGHLLTFNSKTIRKLRHILLKNNEKVKTLIFAPYDSFKVRGVTCLKYKLLYAPPGDVKIPMVVEPAPLAHYYTTMDIYGRGFSRDIVKKWIDTNYLIPFYKKCDVYYPKGKYFFFRILPVHPARRYITIPELAHYILTYMSSQSAMSADLCFKSRRIGMWRIAMHLAGLIYKEMLNYGLVKGEWKRHRFRIKYAYTPYIATHFFTVAALPIHPGKKKIKIKKEYRGEYGWAIDMTWYAPSKSGYTDYIYEYEVLFWIPSPGRRSRPCWAEFWANLFCERYWGISLEEFYEWHDAEIRLVKTRPEKVGYFEYNSSAGTRIGEIKIDEKDIEEARKRCGGGAK